MDARAQTAGLEGTAAPPPAVSVGGRPHWILRLFVIALLLAGAGTVTVALMTIAGGAGESGSSRPSEFGVVMPDATSYRARVGRLLERKRPKRLSGLTIVGAQGTVTVFKPRGSEPDFPSTYLNPNALELIARAIGSRSDTRITVQELRLEVQRSTGRLRWRLRGVQGDQLWRAVLAPNGTKLRTIAAKAA